MYWLKGLTIFVLSLGFSLPMYASAEDSEELHQEVGSAVEVTNITMTSDKKDFEIHLKNGFSASFPMSQYSADELQSFYDLPLKKQEKFLKRRYWTMVTAVRTLTAMRLVSGSLVAVKDGIYYVGRKSAVAGEFYSEHFGRVRSHQYNSLSVFRPVTPEHQQTWSTPQDGYTQRVYAFYQNLFRKLDHFLVRNSNFMDLNEIGLFIAISGSASAKAGTSSKGLGTSTTYFSIGLNFKQLAFFVNSSADHENTIGVNASFGVSARMGAYLMNRRPGELPQTLEVGKIHAPLGPAVFVKTRNRLEVSVSPLSLGFISGIAALGSVFFFGASYDTVVKAMMGGTFLDWWMWTGGTNYRAMLFEARAGLFPLGAYARLLPGIEVAREGVKAAWREEIRPAIRSITSVANYFRKPEDVLARLNNRLDNRTPYRRSCSLLMLNEPDLPQ